MNQLDRVKIQIEGSRFESLWGHDKKPKISIYDIYK